MSIEIDRHYSIQKNVPLPRVCQSTRIYPFAEMHVGDSFQLADQSLAEVERVRAAASYWGTRHNTKFAVRRVDPITKNYRCWRIE